MNKDTWDLSIFYNGFDDPALRGDINAVRSALLRAETMLQADEPAAQKLQHILAAQDELAALLEKTMSFVQLTLEADNTHAQALRCMDELSLLGVDVQLLSSRFTRYIGGVENLEEVIASSEALKPYAFLLREEAQRAQHMTPADMEQWMLRMSLNGGDAFSKLRSRLMGTLTASLNGQELPLPAVRGMAYDPDPAVRKAAYEAELACYPKVETSMAYCLGAIKGECQTLCQLQGWDDPLTQQLSQSRMDRQTLDAMWAACREYLPHFRRYLRKKAQLMGYENGLPFYELFAPMGKSSLRYTADEARKLLVDTFGKVDPDMGVLMDEAFENRWIDLYPREGKSGGAFCSGCYEQDQSRILTNFVGSYTDVSTLAHELGHAWHNRCLQRVPRLLTETPMPLAETASIFNETLLRHEVSKQASEQERFTLLEGSLQEGVQVIVDIYSRFLFEQSVFEARKTHMPTAEELNALMLKAQDETYGDGLDPAYRHSGMWVCKVHYYSTSMHYYNYPYAFGHLFGLGVFRRYLEEGAAFLPKYHALLASCGSASVADVAASVGIDVRSPQYWRSALDMMRAEIDEFMRLCEER